ncbi:hypothetical protein TSUD_04410 [Trifolium subterraneum]|nr:hypothetical protein TSUD_04410 [Trifolium subterraneum]
MQRIPDGFVHQMEGTTCGLVSLTGPSGNNWQVRLVEQDNCLFFHHGWSTFVGDHHLEYGDLLVFRYEGHLHFTVQVFGENACEKEAAFHTECNLNSINFDNIKGQKSDAKETSSLDVVSGQQGIAGRDLSKYEVVKPISMIRETEETYKEFSASAVPVPLHTGNSNEDQDKKSSKIGQDTVLSIDLKKSGRASNTSKKMGLSPKSKAVHKKPAVPRKHRVEDELSSQAKAGLRMLFALDEQRVAEAFSSPFPNFVKIMKKFNVSGSYTLVDKSIFNDDFLW